MESIQEVTSAFEQTTLQQDNNLVISTSWAEVDTNSTSTSSISVGSSATVPSSATVFKCPPCVTQEQHDNWKCRATQTTPRMDLLRDGEDLFFDSEHAKYIYMDAEGNFISKEHHRLGRAAVLNSAGQTILDVYRYYSREDNIQKRIPSPEFNIEWQDLEKRCGARPAHQVERELKKIFNGHHIVLHGGKNDLTAFYIEQNVFANSTVVDTQHMYAGLRHWVKNGDPTPGLAACVDEALKIPSFDAHNPGVDAEMTRRIYLKQFPDRELPKAIDKPKRDYAPNGRGGGYGRGIYGGRGGQGGRGGRDGSNWNAQT